MSESVRASSLFTTLLRYALDVRAMILLSLLLQIALSFLGKRRKHSVSLINKIILWFAYQSKDWVTIAALGKLTSPIMDVDIDNLQGIGSLWAPLLILHLGGPDTITAYSFQDTQLWTRHLLTLVVQSILAFCVIFLSMPEYSTFFFLLLTIPLCFAGIIKYIERILCLKATNSMKTKRIISIFKNPNHLSHPLLDHQESKIVLLGYALFSAMRPDVNNYLSQKEYPLSFKVRIRTYLRKTNHQVKLMLQDLLERNELRRSNSHLTHFDIAVVELGFIFDVVYTKAAFIYTRKGFILRLISFTLSVGMLVYVLISVEDLDFSITLLLLVGAVALDICTVFSILSSDWAVILMHNNCLARKILQYVLQFFPCFLPQQKRWSVRMGQFDLLNYCWNSRKARVYRFLQKCCSYDNLEHWHRFKYTRFVEVPSCLKPKDVYQRRLDSFFSGDSFEATRGERTLDELRGGISDIRTDLEWSIKVDFDASIIAWHLATSICYHQDNKNLNNAPNEAMKISKYLSDYMMHLLVIRPAMLLPDDCSSFWLDRALDVLRDTASKASNKNAAFDSLLLDLPEFSPQTAMENLPKYAGYLATKLNQYTNRWKLIKAMWIEMLLYAAHSCQNVNHVTQLGQYGREFLSIIWVMGGYRVIQELFEIPSIPVIAKSVEVFNAGIILSKSNYEIWSHFMEMHIVEREKLFYIHDKTKPPVECKDRYEKRYVENHKVKRWLLMSEAKIMKRYNM
ncbi:hypothetical protein SLEP1_g14010 [Rubroshorea leprosula]|uniref:DUF4220 domain-containing protein n=1 Tax=Rubroshorea leprosula TaxID=152421 RepID=A0AAV5ISC3_9ROSI|nr:hypothetical protein SLEP1_g14010 [Rubroshorea leprosula]